MAILYDQLILGECTATLASLPRNSVDAVITDPPYGLGRRQPNPNEIREYLRGLSSLDTRGDVGGTQWEMPAVRAWKAVARVLRPGGYLVVFSAARTLDVMLAGIRAGGLTVVGVHGWIHKQGLGRSRAKLKPAWEPIIIAAKGDPARPRTFPVGAHAAKVAGGHLPHPTIKPLTLVRDLVRAFVPMGGVVLDPYVGSGTTAVAALKEGRRYIAIEGDRKYHAGAAARIALHKRRADCAW